MTLDVTPLTSAARSRTLGGSSYRAFAGADGRGWVVYAIPSSVRHPRGDPYLLFESIDVLRRIWTFPDNWHDLTDAGLYALGMQIDRRPRKARPDRRWHPATLSGESGEWERTTRLAIFESIQLCVSKAIRGASSTELLAREPHAPDAVFQELRASVDSYARTLYALGHSASSASAVIAAAARKVSEPTTLHPSIVSTLRQWCHDAQPLRSQTRPVPLLTCARCGCRKSGTHDVNGRRGLTLARCSNPWCPDRPGVCPECTDTGPHRVIPRALSRIRNLECAKCGYSWQLPLAR